MKLNLIFILMDLLTILAYPFVFVYGRLVQFTRPATKINPTNLLVSVPNTTVT